MTSPRKSPTAVVLVVAFMLAALLSPSAAGAQDHSCSGWSSGGQDIGDFHGTVWRNTDARKGPSTHSSCDRGWDYSKGTRVKVTAQSGGFYWATNTATGDWAWLAKDSVDPDGQVTLTASSSSSSSPSSPSAPAASTSSSGDCSNGWITDRTPVTHRTVTLTQSTDARKGPSSHATCDRGFDYGRGNRVEIHAQSGNFYWVKRLSDGDVGWIAKNSVGNTVPASSPAASTRETAPTNADTEVADYKAWVTNAPSGLNVRKTPSSSGSKVTKISNGKQVTVIKHNGNWRLVYFDGRVQGYVSGSYLTRNQPGRGDVITLPQAPQPNTNITNPFEGNRVTRPQAPQPNTNITNPFEGNRTRPNLGNKAWGYCESAKVGIAVFGGEKGVCWFANNSGDVVWFETTAAIYGWGLPVGVALAVGTANDGDLSKLEGFSNCDSVGVGPAGTTRCIGRDGGSDVSMRTVTIGVGPPAELSGGLSRAIKVHRETDPRHKESTRANICFAHAGLGDSQPPFCTPDVA